MGKQMQIALDATDFKALLNKLPDKRLRAWRLYTEIPDPLHAPVSEFEQPHRQIWLTFPDSRINMHSADTISFKSDYIEIELCFLDNKKMDPRESTSEMIPCLFYGRIYLDTHRMHYSEEDRTMQYFEEDECHLAILKKRYDAICSIIKKNAAAVIRDSSKNIYIWPHTYENMLLRHTTGVVGGGIPYVFKEQDIRLMRGIQASAIKNQFYHSALHAEFNMPETFE